MLNCNIVKDLLPSYIDELVSEETAHEVKLHLQNCADCNAVYMQMKNPIVDSVPKSSKREVDYLKKIKKGTIKKLLELVHTN